MHQVLTNEQHEQLITELATIETNYTLDDGHQLSILNIGTEENPCRYSLFTNANTGAATLTPAFFIN